MIYLNLRRFERFTFLARRNKPNGDNNQGCLLVNDMGLERTLDKMESRVEEAAAKKMCGYNCAQAVACTYCDLAGIDEDTMKNITQGFAVGMGGSMEGTCGALIGATCVLGLINRNPQKTMKETRNMVQAFKEQNGTVVCKELKGIVDGKVRRECIDCVRDAACLLEANLE